MGDTQPVMQFLFGKIPNAWRGLIYYNHQETEHIFEYRISLADAKLSRFSEIQQRLKARAMIRHITRYYECMPRSEFLLLHEYIENCPIQNTTDPAWLMHLLYLGSATRPHRFKRTRNTAKVVIELEYENLESMHWSYPQE